MDISLYIMLSLMMGLQFAIWGAWSPVLAARLLGPLRFNGRQTGWIYGTLPVACIIAPLLSGQVADKHINTEYILVVSHLAGAVLMFVAAKQERFTGLLVTMLAYSFFYAATMPLVTSLMFRHATAESGVKVEYVFLWIPLGWAIAGFTLSGWRWKFKTGEKGADCMVLAAILSFVMAVVCLALPSTPPANQGTAPILDALSMLRQVNVFVFFAVSMVIAGLMQFYFLGTARFLQQIGVANRNVPAAMAIAQAAQAVFTVFALGWAVGTLGFKTTLIIGALLWVIMYGLYAKTKSREILVPAQALHGLAYVFFILAGQMLANELATDEVRASMQALIITATLGVGLFLGTRLAGVVMDKFKTEEGFQWSRIYAVPCAICGAATLLFALAYW